MHVRLPDVCLARRRYVVEVIGAALLTAGRGVTAGWGAARDTGRDGARLVAPVPVALRADQLAFPAVVVGAGRIG